LAAKVKEHFGADAELVRSSGGVFEVTLDGALVYSKKKTGQFPNEDALLIELSRRAGRA